jgi:hypothetical protein
LTANVPGRMGWSEVRVALSERGNLTILRKNGKHTNVPIVTLSLSEDERLDLAAQLLGWAPPDNKV